MLLLCQSHLAAPAVPPPEIHPKLVNKFVCRDLWSDQACAKLTPEQCSPAQRKNCAQTCQTCTPLVVPVNVGYLVDGELPIPDGSSPLLLEIGASDRNTMDVEVLPRRGFEQAFLVTAEPLIDKYARGLTRSRRADKSEDRAEPMGQQHERGFILPLAISPAPASGHEVVLSPGHSDRRAFNGHKQSGVGNGTTTTSGSGELKAFNVGANAGCASLATLATKTGKQAASFGGWCAADGAAESGGWAAMEVAAELQGGLPLSVRCV